MLRRAPALQADDLVAVITPSSPVRTPQRLARGVAALEALGWRVRTGPMASAVEFGDRSPAVRADEINEFLRDPSVRAIFVTLGGYNSNAILDRVDWAALRRDPKVVVGYSDVTGLLAGALTR